MTLEEFESQALKLDPKERARLAGKLLDSLETLSPDELDRVWAEEARRRDREFDSGPSAERSSDDVHHDARKRLG